MVTLTLRSLGQIQLKIGDDLTLFHKSPVVYVKQV